MFKRSCCSPRCGRPRALSGGHLALLRAERLGPQPGRLRLRWANVSPSLQSRIQRIWRCQARSVDDPFHRTFHRRGLRHGRPFVLSAQTHALGCIVSGSALLWMPFGRVSSIVAAGTRLPTQTVIIITESDTGQVFDLTSTVLAPTRTRVRSCDDLSQHGQSGQILLGWGLDGSGSEGSWGRPRDRQITWAPPPTALRRVCLRADASCRLRNATAAARRTASISVSTSA